MSRDGTIGGDPIQVSLSGSGGGQVTGNVASGATDSGNPVKVAGVYNSTLPTVTDGKRVDLQSDSRGQPIFNLGVKLDYVNDSILAVGSVATPSVSFTRPVDTTAYAIGDLVANSVTAGSVTPIAFTTAARVSGGSGLIRSAKLKTSNTSLTAASFRLHLYAADPSASTGITNGDNGAFLTKEAGWLGAIDITLNQAFSDAASGIGTPNVGSEAIFVATGQTIWGLVEARGAYTPTSAEVLTVTLSILQN
jgi:hypothetical protein